MDKKTIYYSAAAIVLIIVIALIIVMQNQGQAPAPTGGQPQAGQQAPKTESELNQKVAEKLSLPENKLPLRVTLDDNGQSYSASPGTNISLMLGTDYNWTVSTSDEKVLAKRAVDITDARMQGVYQIAGEGSATLSAKGVCKSGSKCEKPNVDFVFNVEGVISENQNIEDLVK